MDRDINKTFNNLSVGLVHDNSPFPIIMRKKSLFYKYSLSFDLSVTICDLAHDKTKDKSLGELWSAIKPKNDEYLFEIATELPFYFPTMEGKSEYLFNINNLKIIINLRMLKYYCGKGFPFNNGYRYYIVHRNALESVIEQTQKEDDKKYGLHIIPMKTFISKQIICKANNAEKAVQDNYLIWRDELIKNISDIMKTLRIVKPDFLPLFHDVSTGSFPIFWLATKGKGKGKNGVACEQFVGNIGQSAFKPLININKEESKLIKKNLTSDNIPTYKSALSLARIFHNNKYLDLAIIQICIACESILSQEYIVYIKKRGVSNTKLNDYNSDIHFAQLLNLHLFTIRNVLKLQNSERIIGDINWARKRRNEIVHIGKSEKEVTMKKIKDVIHSASKLIEFLENKKFQKK